MLQLSSTPGRKPRNKTDRLVNPEPQFLSGRPGMMSVLERQKGYRPKDRNNRYSHEGARNWGDKHAQIMDAFLARHKPRTLVKGVLHVQKTEDFGTLKAANTKGRSRLLRELRRFGKANGIDVQLRAVVHITGELAYHFDFVAYSNAPFNAVKRVIKRAANKAGWCAAVVHVNSIRGTARYTFKADGDRAGYAYLLAENNGITATMTTKGFWGDTSPRLIWEGIKRERRERAASGASATRPDRPPPDPDRVLAGTLRQIMPRSPRASMSAASLAFYTGWMPSDVLNLLLSMPKVHQTGEGDFWYGDGASDQWAAANRLRMTGGRVPYHRTYHPHIDDVVKPPPIPPPRYVPPGHPLTDDEFVAELDDMRFVVASNLY